MKIIEITQKNGKKHLVLVDDGDYEYLKNHSWCIKQGNHASSKPYAVRGTRIKGKFVGISMHREIAKPLPDEFVDHINHNTLDNRRENLRTVSHRENMLNRLPVSTSSSRYKGVYWYDRVGKFVTKFQNKHIGYFDDEVDAALAYNHVAFKEGQMLAYLNKPSGVPAHKLLAMPKSYWPYQKLNKYRGVRRRSYNCWEAYINYRNERRIIGYFRGMDGEKDAAKAYDAECDRLGVLKRKNFK